MTERERISINQLTKGRVALVLQGGGAKGAYQIGVWKALWELGIRKFCAIAGTSVGGLNAVLIGQGNPSEAGEVWSTIIAAGVLKTPSSQWKRIAWWLLGYVFIFLPVMIAMPYVLLPDFMPGRNLDLRFAGFVLSAMGLYLRLQAWMLQGAVSRKKLVLPLFVVGAAKYDRVGIFLFQLGLLNIVIASFGLTSSNLDWTSAFWISSLGFFMSTIFLAIGVRLVLKTLGEAPLFLRERLNEKIRDIARIRVFPNCTGPLWMTLTRHSVYYHPFRANPFDFEFRSRHGQYDPIDWREAEPETGWTPFYLNVKKEPDYSWALEATSAIPFAFMGIERNGEFFVDGGARDNTPTAPVLFEKPDYVILICVNAGDDLEPQLKTVEDKWQQYYFSTATKDAVDQVRKDWISSVSESDKEIEREFTIPFLKQAHITPEIPKLVPPTKDIQFIFLKPSRAIARVWPPPIRDLFTGTMNFRASYVDQLMKLGYEDTMRYFSGGCMI